MIFLAYREDKGDGSDMETSMSDEDFVVQDEICKSRLASIKRVSSYAMLAVSHFFLS